MVTSARELGFFRPEECDLQRQVLLDDELQDEFARRGYVIVPFLEAADVDRLYRGYAEVADSEPGVNPPGAYNDTFAEFSIMHSRPDFRQRAYELICSVLVPRADQYLDRYRPLFANYVNKPPHTGVVPAHQNFSVVDERRFQSVSVWVALVDCTLDNGTMLMLDGSHLHLRGRRGMWAYETYSHIEEELVERFLTPIDVRAGEAVILDDALLHYSPPNSSDERRLAIQFVMLPQEADAMWFRPAAVEGDDIDVEVLNVEPGYFFDFWQGSGDARFGSVVDRLRIRKGQLDVPHLRSLLAA